MFGLCAPRYVAWCVSRRVVAGEAAGCQELCVRKKQRIWNGVTSSINAGLRCCGRSVFAVVREVLHKWPVYTICCSSHVVQHSLQDMSIICNHEQALHVSLDFSFCTSCPASAVTTPPFLNSHHAHVLALSCLTRTQAAQRFIADNCKLICGVSALFSTSVDVPA